MATTTATILENADTTQVADILTLVPVDPDTVAEFHDNVVTLTSTQSDPEVAATFEIVGNVLRRKVGAQLTYATKNSYTVKVLVADRGDPNLAQVVDVTVHVSEANKPPTGLQTTTATIAENAGTGDPAADIVTLVAVDPDLTAPNRSNGFALDATQAPGIAGLFEVVAGKLRRKAQVALVYAVANQYQIRIAVTDQANPALQTVALVTVNISETNKAPTGLILTTGSVPENTAADRGALSIMNLIPLDPDLTAANRNNTVALSTSQVEPAIAANFEVVGGTLRRKAGASLVYATKSVYIVRVLVADQNLPGLSCLVELTVQVTEVNKPPTGLAVLTGTVPENTGPDQEPLAILTLTPVDPDLTPANRDNTVALSATQTDPAILANFEITTVAGVGEVLRRKANASLRFADTASYTITVLVADRTNPGLQVVAAVRVDLSEVNKAPTGLVTTTATCAENAGLSDPATAILTLVASDPDLTAVNRHNDFALDPSQAPGIDGLFEVVGDQLRRKAQVALVYAVTNRYQIRIIVMDQTNPTLRALATVTVNLSETNKAPTGLSLTTGSVDENTAAGQGALDILTLTPVDPDTTLANRNNTVSLQGAQSEAGVSANFEVVGNVLRRKANASLIYATKSRYTVQILVADRDAPGLNRVVDVTVTVNEVNKAPTGLILTTGSVDENTTAGQPALDILILTPVDPDLLDDHRHNTVALHSTQTDTGVLANFILVAVPGVGDVLRRKADAVLHFAEKSTYIVKVLVADQATPSLNRVVDVAVQVREVNKPATGLSLATQSLAIAEDIENAASVPQTHLLTLQVVDPDLADNFRHNELSFASGVSSEITSRFQLTTDGTLQRKADVVFDYEQGPSSYAIPIHIEDAADPSLAVDATCTVTISPRNDPLWIPRWSAATVGLADPTQAVPVADGLAFRDQDYSTAPEQSGSNGLRLRFALYPSGPGVTPVRGAGAVDRSLHGLGFKLPAGADLVATGDLGSTVAISVGTSTSSAAVISYESGDPRVLLVQVQGDHAAGVPVLTIEQLTAILHGITYRLTLNGSQTARTVADVVVEAGVERPWQGGVQEWVGSRRVSPSTANQRPTLEGSPLSGISVARDSSITLTAADLAIVDDYPELGEDLLLAYPPIAGRILDGTGSVLSAGGVIAVSPVTGPGSGGDFTLRYEPGSTSTAASDSFIIQVRDHGVNAAGSGQRTSELYVITVTLTPGVNPSLTAVVSRTDAPPPVFHERQAPVALVPPQATVTAGTLTQLTGWSLYAGPRPAVTTPPNALATRPLARFAIIPGPVAGGMLAVDGQRVRWTADLGDSTGGAVLDPVWNGAGRTLVLHLDDGTSLRAAAAFAQAIGFSRDGHRIADADLYDDLAIGFVATGDPTRLTQAAPTVALQGFRDPPVFTIDPLDVRVATGGTVVGVSEVSDADGLADPATWQVTAGSSQLTILDTQVTAPTEAADDQPARYRITWALTPSAAETSVSLAFSDDAAAIAAGIPGISVTQHITLAQVAAGSDPFAFVSNPPYHQRRGVLALVPLALASAEGLVPATETVDFALTFPDSSTATQRAALARIFLPIPSTRQLQVDLSGVDAPEPGSTLRCVLTANRIVAGSIQIAEQPIVLRVLPALPVIPAGVN